MKLGLQGDFVRKSENMAKQDKSNFFNDVYEVTRLIPYGKVTSYGAIAHYLGSKRGARMVGWALSQVMGQEDIPAHRVVNRVGALTGRLNFQTPHYMQELLMAEDILVKDQQIVDFEKYFWDPSIELMP